MFQVQTDRVLRDTRRQTSAAISGGGIAVIPIYGVITQRGNMVDDVSGPGMVSTQIVTQMLRQAVADEAVSQILLDIDSPGGSVYGVSELGDAILSASAQKPVVAIANSLAASAAYWVGSQAGEFYVTAGGEVGSIGVWQAHQDYSKAMDEAGVKTRSYRRASSRSRAIHMHRWTKKHKDLCSPALMTITHRSPRLWLRGVVCPSLRYERAWAKAVSWALMRLWHKTWWTASPALIRS
jgi:ClpP class serine protease